MKGKSFFYVCAIPLLFVSCFKLRSGGDIPEPVPVKKVWGFKPVYGSEQEAKKVLFSSGAQPVARAGNIYAYRTFLFQMDEGRGIHVIENKVPSEAKRIGFIEVKGCSQISIKDSKLYTNSYDDLVVLDVSNLDDVKEFSRLKGVFAEYRYFSPISLPPGPGFYECPTTQGFVVGWTKDSINQNCYQN